MKLGIATCGRLAEMICGDEAPFPNRSGTELMKFFHALGVDDAIKSQESRSTFAQRAVRSVDSASDAGGASPGPQMVELIEHLAGFYGTRGKRAADSAESAISQLNQVLARHKLGVDAADPKKPRLRSIDGLFISSDSVDVIAERRLFFRPSVFQVPDVEPNPRLVAVMMPFDAQYSPVFDAIGRACTAASLECQRADTIWKNSKIMDDIVHLICEAHIVVSDFTSQNSNVFYETGIAHTLGKHVIPLTQHEGDVPFDLKPHRYIRYLNNREGLKSMERTLTGRLKTLTNQ